MRKLAVCLVVIGGLVSEGCGDSPPRADGGNDANRAAQTKREPTYRWGGPQECMINTFNLAAQDIAVERCLRDIEQSCIEEVFGTYESPRYYSEDEMPRAEAARAECIAERSAGLQ